MESTLESTVGDASSFVYPVSYFKLFLKFVKLLNFRSKTFPRVRFIPLAWHLRI